MFKPRRFGKKVIGPGLFSAALVLSLLTPSAWAGDIPDFMKITAVNDGAPPSKSEVGAFSDVNALNDAMFPIYDQSLRHFTENFRAPP